MKSIIFNLFIGCLLVVNFYSCTPKHQDLLFTNTGSDGDLNFKSQPVSMKVQNINFNVDLLQKNDTLIGQFFDKEITIIIQKKERTKEIQKWIGIIPNDKGSYVIFIKRNNLIIGNIFHENNLYQVRFVGKGIHQLIRLDQSKFKDEAEPIIPKINEKFTPQKDCPNTDPSDIIDVMVVYTQTTETAAGGKDALESEIYLAVEETNFAYSESGVSQRLSLVHIEKVNFAETGNLSDALTWLKSDATVASMRNNYSADEVAMIAENGGSNCGIGYLMDPVTPGFDAWAFCVVARSCATGYYSFGHELGHNMGCRHDCAHDAVTTPYDYAHGYSNCATSPNWRTILSYNNCGETRIPRFSNPNITYNGIPMGVNTGTCKSCDACVLNNTALTVANFRCTSTSAGNVWMKDTWNDNGQEPNPNTASEPMWVSPYIWVRNQQDNLFLHQHQHENPEFGQTNWVYVKLHNGGNSATGSLELRYANASISLSWPTSWTSLSSTSITIPANSTRIVEVPWNNLPGTGHYCMIARWVSASDPMHTVETTDINYNTIQNNNIIWKNLNIVNLFDQDVEVSAEFKANNDFRIEFKLDKLPLSGKTFIEDGGQIFVKFDSVTSNILSDKFKTEGFKKSERNMYQITENNIAKFFIPKSKALSIGKIKLIFKKGKTPTLGIYTMHVIQMSEKNETLGGVSYTIKTTKD